MREENVKTHKYTYVAVTNEQGKRERTWVPVRALLNNYSAPQGGHTRHCNYTQYGTNNKKETRMK